MRNETDLDGIGEAYAAMDEPRAIKSLSGSGRPDDERAAPLDDEPPVVRADVEHLAGDVRHGSVKRVVSGVGDGATATSLVHRFVAWDEAPSA